MVKNLLLRCSFNMNLFLEKNKQNKHTFKKEIKLNIRPKSTFHSGRYVLYGVVLQNAIHSTFSIFHIWTRQMLTHHYMFTSIHLTVINAYCLTNTLILMNIRIPSSVQSLVQLIQFFHLCPFKRYVILFILLLRHFIK